MADPAGPPIYMDLHMPAVATREVAKVDSPPIVDAPNPYGNDPSPTLVVRQIGEAWDKPFAVVFEPHFSINGGTVQQVTKLVRGEVVVGLKVESLVGGQNLMHYVISNPNATETFTEATLDLSFTGRFAVITDKDGTPSELYLGEGSSLSYGGYAVASVGGTNTQASVLFAVGQAPVITANAPVLVTVPIVSAPAFTRIEHLSSGVISLTATGAVSSPFTLWASPDVPGPTWTEITNGTVSASPFVIQDTGVTNHAARFYRFSAP